MHDLVRVAGIVAVASIVVWRLACRIKGRHIRENTVRPTPRNAHMPKTLTNHQDDDASPTAPLLTTNPIPSKLADKPDADDLDADPTLIRVPEPPSLFMRVPSTRSLHSSPGVDPDLGELPRLGTAQAPPPADGLPAPPMPSAYSLSDSLPSGSQLGLKLGSRSLSALFREGSEGRVEQNYWSLDDDARSSSSGEPSVSSPARDDAPSNQHHDALHDVDGAAHGLVFPSAPHSPDAEAVAANPFATESPFYDLSARQRSALGGGGSTASLRARSSTQEGTDSTNGSCTSAQPAASGQSSTAGDDASKAPSLQPSGSGGLRRTLSGSSKRSRQVLEQPCLAIELTVTAGPCKGASYLADDTTTQITVGRLDTNTLSVGFDQEVSGRHLRITWDVDAAAWMVSDVGSLNGSLLNGYSISKAYREPGEPYRLRNGDVLQLGSTTHIGVAYVGRQLLPTELHAAPLVVPDKAPAAAGVEQEASEASAATGVPSALQSGSTLVQPRSAACLGELFKAPALGVEGACCQQTGVEHRRRQQECEDVWLQRCPLHGAPLPAALVCLCDGHTGVAAAVQVRAHLPEHLQAALPAHHATLKEGGDVGGMWREVFAATDAAVRTDEGCTGTAALLWRCDDGNVCLQVANVGDSTALCIELPEEACDAAEGGCPYTELTCEHRPRHPVERARLAAMGVQVSKDGRLYGLNLSRGFGDSCLKEQDLGMSAEPHVSPVVAVPPGGSLLLLMASDGLWDVAPRDRVVQVALEAFHSSFGNVRVVAQALVEHAQKQRSKDDITVLALTVINNGF